LTGGTYPNEKMANTERIAEDVHSHDATFTPKRVICLPIDESECSKHTVQFAISKVVNKEKDMIVLLHTRPAAFNDYSLVFYY
jgi:hypothetical protein